MKISLNGGGITCYDDDCPFKKDCANHASAGDFRSEGGFSPDLVVIDEVTTLRVECKTRFVNPVYLPYSVDPINIDKLGRGEVFRDRDGVLRSYDPYAKMDEESSRYDDYVIPY